MKFKMMHMDLSHKRLIQLRRFIYERKDYLRRGDLKISVPTLLLYAMQLMTKRVGASKQDRPP